MVKPGALDVLFLLGADEVDPTGSDAFRVYLAATATGARTGRT